ncbi:MAG: stage III sporulation protein AE [Deltaproteobacteria bacterium]
MKRCLILLTALILVVLALPITALGGDRSEEEVTAFTMDDAMKAVDFNALEQYKDNIDGEIDDYLQGKTVKEWFIAFIKGEWHFNLGDIIQGILRYLFGEVTANYGLLGKILILSVISALLLNLQNSFSSSVTGVSYLACFLALSAIALGSFKVVLDIGHHTIDNMVTFMMAILPQMLVLSAGMGNINSSAMLFPLLGTAATAFATAIKNVVFPLIILSAMLHLINNMSTSLKVEKMAKFFTQIAQMSLAFFLTIFVGVLTLRALYASVLDKVALRTTKFVTDNAIPLVGKMFSDTIEVAAGYMVMLKQALGIYGALIVFLTVLYPLLKIVAIALIYKVSAAIAEPLGDSRTAAVLEIMSTHLFLMLASVAAVALMFFIMIAIVIGMSNGMAAI